MNMPLPLPPMPRSPAPSTADLVWLGAMVPPAHDDYARMVDYVRQAERERLRAQIEAERLQQALQATLTQLNEINRRTDVLARLHDVLLGCRTAHDVLVAGQHHAQEAFAHTSGRLSGAAGTLTDGEALTWGDFAACTVREAASIEARGLHLGTCELAFATAAQGEAARAQLRAFVDQLAAALVALEQQEALRGLASRDALTGLFNRRYLDELLEREVLRGQRAQRPLTVAIFDIDHFKRFNDTWGHDAGDYVLREMAHLATHHMRASDAVCRFGGEEFVFVLPDTAAEAVLPRLQAFVQAVRALALAYEGKALGAISVSMGVATLPADAHDASGLLRAADHALYRAKAGGRDRIEVARTPIDAEFLQTLSRAIV